MSDYESIEKAFDLVDKFKSITEEAKPEPKYYHKDITLTDGYHLTCNVCPHQTDCRGQCKEVCF